MAVQIHQDFIGVLMELRRQEEGTDRNKCIKLYNKILNKDLCSKALTIRDSEWLVGSSIFIKLPRWGI